MDKMTFKEFKEILESTGMYWENWGFEGILNQIARISRLDAYADAESGHMICYETEITRANIIHMELQKRGFFDN